MSVGAVMWQGIQICCALFALHSAAAPAHINRLALFPDKSAWCEAKNITQIVGHTGCQPRSIQNRACLGQCFSYSVPNTFPQSTESLAHCDSCMPAQTQWEVVTLECPGSEDSPRVDKLVERILHCSCQSCSKESAQEGVVMQLYPADNTLDSDQSLSDPLIADPSHTLSHSDTLTDKKPTLMQTTITRCPTHQTGLEPSPYLSTIRTLLIFADLFTLLHTASSVSVCIVMAL